MKQIDLRDKRSIPQLGFGTWQIPDGDAASAVRSAIEIGYRSIDTASIYQNERGVGEGIKTSGIARKDIYLTTKLWNTDHMWPEAQKALEKSLKLLGTDYLDLYLVHWPSPKHGHYIDAWKSLIRMQEQGVVKSIGVCNYEVSHLESIMRETGVTPVINQIELHPKFQQKGLRDYHKKHQIITEAWSPLAQGHLADDAVLTKIGKKYGKSLAQIALRWQMELGHVTIPKSVTPARIKENFDIFDFKLSEQDLEEIQRLDDVNGRVGPHPTTADF